MRGVLFWIVLVGAAASNQPATNQASYDRAGTSKEEGNRVRSDNTETKGKGKGRAIDHGTDEQETNAPGHDTDTRRFFVALVVKVGFLLREQDEQAVLGMLARFVGVQGVLGRGV